MEIVLYDVIISTVADLSFKNERDIQFIDFNFTLNAKPLCSDLKRIHSVELVYNCTVDTEQEEIWYNIIEPSLTINMPDEEYYAKINPDKGF